MPTRRAVDGVIQIRYNTDLTVEDYVSHQAWWNARPPGCPFHKQGGCQLRPHGSYARKVPAGVRVRRFRCPQGRQVEPENVEKDLPRLVGALEKRGRKVVLITTDINDAEDPLACRVIRTADGLGVPFFRMAYYRYDLERPVLDQLETHRRTVSRLGEYLNDFQIMGLYQNHAGKNLVGASVWDQLRLLEGTSEDRIAAVFDVRHATVEGGQPWPLLWRLIRDRVRPCT